MEDVVYPPPDIPLNPSYLLHPLIIAIVE